MQAMQMEMAAKGEFPQVRTAALRDVESLWNAPEKDGARLVFQP